MPLAYARTDEDSDPDEEEICMEIPFGQVQAKVAVTPHTLRAHTAHSTHGTHQTTVSSHTSLLFLLLAGREHAVLHGDTDGERNGAAGARPGQHLRQDRNPRRERDGHRGSV